MKPAYVINQGETFVTLRTSTDRPAEIREALEIRDITQVFKGDQNQGWDAVLANHCLARALGDTGSDVTFFVQDERLGTADSRIARELRDAGREFALTEDYYRGRAGAVWEHQDLSYGLFFTESVSPEHFRAAGLHLRHLALQWDHVGPEAWSDPAFGRALSSLGIAIPGGLQDAATRLGPAAEPEALGNLFEGQPSSWLYHALTKTDGLFGIVPIRHLGQILSGIPADHRELRELGRQLLVDVCGRGALRMAANSTHRRGIANRIREVATWADEYIGSHPAASVAEFQAAMGVWLTNQIFPLDQIQITLASRITEVTVDAQGDQLPENSLHSFFDLALRYPQQFSTAYNDALNRVGYGLQRMKYVAATGRLTLPFFVEFAPDAPDSPKSRFSIELSGVERTLVELTNETFGSYRIEAGEPIRSAGAFFRLLQRQFPGRPISVIGKAATFAAELQRAPRGLGLPRQGSKYAPLVDHLVSGLRDAGVLHQPTGLLIRIGLNALDRLHSMGELPLRIPRFLPSPTVVTARELAQRWRGWAHDAARLLDGLRGVQVGQHPLVMALIAGGDVADRPAAIQLAKGLADCLPSLRAMIPHGAGEYIRTAWESRREALRQRRELAQKVQAEGRTGRLVPDPHRRRELDEKIAGIDAALGVLYGALVRRLWQRAESLPYLNDRPYTLALYLLFGQAIFPPICREVEFDIEFVSPSLLVGEVGAPAPGEMERTPLGCG